MARVLMSALALVFMVTAGWAQSTYKIEPGDTLKIEVLEDQSLNRSVLVLPDGTVSVPLVGTVKAGGKTVGEVQAQIAAALAPNFATKPNVFVNVASLANGIPARSGGSITVYVMGEVNNPGKATVRSGTNVLQLLAQTGGFTKFAATKRIQIRRTDRSGKTSVFTFNYKAIENGSASVSAIVLRSGDVVVVPERRLFE